MDDRANLAKQQINEEYNEDRKQQNEEYNEDKGGGGEEREKRTWSSSRYCAVRVFV